MAKIDLARDLKPLYAPPKGRFGAVDVPRLAFLMVDGAGDPNAAPAYRHAVEALYAAAYGVKFMSKLGPEAVDFRVMPLEGLWWAEDMDDFLSGRRDRWQWTMMIAMPDMVTEAMVRSAAARAAAKKELPALPRLRLRSFTEGRAMQTLYLGPFADEGPTILALHRAIAEAGHALAGRHHEIYLSDPRRTDPAKLKTIIRQPFA